MHRTLLHTRIRLRSFKLFRRYGIPKFGKSDLVAILTVTLWPSKHRQFIFGLNYTNNQSLVKFHPLICMTSCQQTFWNARTDSGHLTQKHDFDTPIIGRGIKTSKLQIYQLTEADYSKKRDLMQKYSDKNWKLCCSSVAATGREVTRDVAYCQLSSWVHSELHQLGKHTTTPISQFKLIQSTD